MAEEKSVAPSVDKANACVCVCESRKIPLGRKNLALGKSSLTVCVRDWAATNSATGF